MGHDGEGYRTGSFHHDGHRLVYDRYGDEGPLLVYLHGLLLDSDINRGIAELRSLDVRPIADELLRSADGQWSNDVERGEFGWSNELASHLVEVKNNDPRQPLASLRAGFEAELAEIGTRLDRLGARLMPGAMHPWMDPRRETRLWPPKRRAMSHRAPFSRPKRSPGH